MENKKDIGTAFREKLNDLDKIPSDAAWNSINAELRKKKKRRIAFYFFSGTIALLLLLLSGSIFKDNNFRKNPIPKTEKTVTNKEPKNSVTTKEETNMLGSKNQIDSIGKNSRLKRTKTIVTKRLIKSTDTVEEYEIVSTYKVYITKTKKTVPSKKTVAKPAVKKTISKNRTLAVKQKKAVSKKAPHKIAVAKYYTRKINATKKTVVKKPSPEREITQTEIKTDSFSTEIEQKENTENLKTIDSVKIDTKVTDSLTKKKILKKEKKPYVDREDTESKKAIYLTAFAGPTYYTPFSKSSSLMNNDDEYSKKANIDLNYGIYARVMFSEKLGARLGFSITNVAYTTTIPNTGTSSWSLQPTNIILNNDMTKEIFNEYAQDAEEIDLKQTTKYLEFPMEAYYIIQDDKKIGIDLIGGFSTYFLRNSTVTAEVANKNPIKIGQAGNVKEIFASANLGLSFNYKILEKLQFDITPMAKYQINQYSGNTNFKSILFTIQGGLTYRLFN